MLLPSTNAKIYKDSQWFPIHKNLIKIFFVLEKYSQRFLILKNLVKILLYQNFLENVRFRRIEKPNVKKKCNKYLYIFQVVKDYKCKDLQKFLIHKYLVKILLYWNLLEKVRFVKIRKPNVKKKTKIGIYSKLLTSTNAKIYKDS